MPAPQEPISNVTSLPRGGRDGFIADTAIRLDRLEASIAMLHRDAELSRSAIDALTDSTEQAKRLRAFEESLRNSREYKIEEILRSTREMKSRLDRSEGDKSFFASLPHNTWESVNKKIQELSAITAQVAASETRVKRNGYLFTATSFILVCTIIAFMLEGTPIRF